MSSLTANFVKYMQIFGVANLQMFKVIKSSLQCKTRQCNLIILLMNLLNKMPPTCCNSIIRGVGSV